MKFGLVGFCTSILLISVLILSLASNDFVSFQNSFDSALADDSSSNRMIAFSFQPKFLPLVMV